jgi:hypothetical protein
MKKIKILVLFCVLSMLKSCQKNQEYTKKYIVSKSDDNNWTTSGVIECDSVTMENINKATLWVDGRKLSLQGQIIKIFTNTNYKTQ